ncbi:MAG TPA: ribonuclease III [Candidatus Paceibacterota bacterium]
MSDLTVLEGRIGVSFTNTELLEEAVTHRSYLNEHREYAGAHNERLEFLGDAVLELASTRFLFDTFPEKPEGELTAYRAALVNTVSLAESAQALHVGEHLRLSKGEARDTGRARQIILANAFEATIGAIYLDQGYEAADAFIGRTILVKLDALIAKGAHQDAKSRFQEFAQEKRGVTPSYKVLAEEGPDHAKRFTVGVYLGVTEVARGEGPAKQEAEQVAAQNALAESGW